MSLTTPARTKSGSKLLALTLAVGLLAGPIAVDAAPAEAATKKCSATMSIKKPRQYSNTSVKVSKVGSKAKVTTIAHYKTTKTKKKATASKKGKASLKYYISGATPGKKVSVTVTAKKGKTTWKCSTSFKPKKK
ncbi:MULTISPECIES: hypothetical protein [unclassified Brevibacterium]|uniref:hypothetical protein n=1 Tax=unclassified Brevibacterium TaxID=2614124 RepID=UPI0010931426|nr:hypothetical protein [Brevibacterium sp. S22]TGD30598.1 hypothetical protein EB835_11730 [Brevibacterium sp. S22]